MRGFARMTVGVLKSGDLLGVHGDGMIDSCDSESFQASAFRRVMSPQREYPIFTPGLFREPGVQLGSSYDHSRANFQAFSDGPGIWKEIHTDTHSNGSRGNNILTRSASAVSLERTLGSHSPTPAGGGRIVVKAVPHSPQHVNILSPQLRPLEKSSPKHTQLHVASPRVTLNGKLTPMVTNHLTLNPEQQLQARPTTYDHDPNVEPHRLPPASAARSPHQATLRSPVTVSRSPGRTWKSSLQWAVSPASTFRGTDQHAQISKASTRDVNCGSFQGSSGRATACVNSVPSWRGCGDGGGHAVLAALDREINCQEFSGELERPDRVGSKKVVTSRSGAYKIFNFLSRSRKNPANHGTGSTASTKLTTTTADLTSLESDDVVRSVSKPDSESIKVLDYTIKTLRYKLEQANQKRSTAVEEVRALQSALEASDEKCRQLSQRCQELLKSSARSNMEPEPPGFSSSQEVLNPVLHPPDEFLKVFPEVFEQAITTLRKLASAICYHIRENGESATQVITALLEQHKVGRCAVNRMPRNVIILYFESFLNQVMFESFENVSFEPNGAASIVCPEGMRQQSYQSFQSLKPLEWGAIEKEWRRKPDAVVVDADFHRFFVVRMELVLSQLGRVAENCESERRLMASFFDAVKAVWLVHHLAFAFREPVLIFRVAPGAEFDARFMEPVAAFLGEAPAGVRSKISVMLNPGFIINRRIIKCQVYCSSSSSNYE